MAERISSSTPPTGLAKFTFVFHDNEEVGPGLLAQIAKKTGLRPEDL